MRLLFLSHRLPYPPHKGEKIRALNELKFLARRHEVFVACPIDDRDDLDLVHAADLRRHACGLVYVRVRPSLRKCLALAALLRSRSITVDYFYSKLLQRRIDELIAGQGIEAVFCSSSPMAEYVFRSRHAARLASCTRVMDLIDVDSFKWHQYARESSLWTAWIYRHEARRLANFEQRVAREFDHLLVVTEQEKRCFPGAVPRGRLLAMPNGVDLEYFSPRYVSRVMPRGPALVFTGVMDYRPNVDGIRWFVERVLPRIQSVIADVQLYIVGNRPSAEVRRLGGRSGVTVTGFVEDVRQYLAVASLCVVPLRIARGIQNKVLEAMAMGRAVVTTQAAFEGIRAQPGRDLIVTAGEAEFSAAVVELLRDPQRAAQIGRYARICAEQRYSWTANLELLNRILPGELRSSSSGASPSAQSAGVCAAVPRI